MMPDAASLPIWTSQYVREVSVPLPSTEGQFTIASSMRGAVAAAAGAGFAPGLAGAGLAGAGFVWLVTSAAASATMAATMSAARRLLIDARHRQVARCRDGRAGPAAEQREKLHARAGVL